MIKIILFPSKHQSNILEGEENVACTRGMAPVVAWVIQTSCLIRVGIWTITSCNICYIKLDAFITVKSQMGEWQGKFWDFNCLQLEEELD